MNTRGANAPTGLARASPLQLCLAAAKGFAAALMLAITISMASGLVPQTRLENVMRQALDSQTVMPRWGVNDWGECVTLIMQYLRHRDIARNAIETRWLPAWPQHSCVELRAILEGQQPLVHQLVAYQNYAFGARHLHALVLSFADLSQAFALYKLLSYGAVVAMFVGAWLASPLLASTVVLPVSLCLLFAFTQQIYATNMSWAPGFFVGFSILAVFMAAKNFFSRYEQRVALFCFLGAIVSYLDMLQGSLPVVLSLTIVFNHFFYTARSAHASFWQSAMRDAILISTCIAAGFVLTSAIRLSIVSITLDAMAWQKFFGGLSSRMGDHVPGRAPITLSDLAAALWAHRGRMTDNELASTILFIGGACAWFATVLILAVRFHNVSRSTVVGVAVLALAAIGILAWYPLFPNHTMVHPWLMVRMLALPIAFGFSAAIITAGDAKLAQEEEPPPSNVAPSRKSL